MVTDSPTFLQEEELLQAPLWQSRGPFPAVYLWQHCFEAPQLLAWARTHCPSCALEDFQQLKPKRLVERLSVYLLLQQIAPQFRQIAHKESGAPYFPHTDVAVSISHTRHTYGLSLSSRAHGIDLEKWGDKALRVRSMFIHEGEEKLFRALDTWGTEAQIATLLWSAKESLYKLYDHPGLSFRDDMQLTALSSDTLQADLPRLGETAQVYFQAYPDFVFTCAVSTASDNI